MKGIKPFTILLAAATLLFLILSPFYLLDEAVRNIRLEWLKVKKPVWTGVIRVWHISGWPVGKGTAVSWLKARAAEFEKANAWVYIEIEDLTWEETKAKLAAGERPDMVSFCGGMAPELDLTELEMPAGLRHQLAFSGAGLGISVPYMMGGYFILANKTLFETADIPLPEENWTIETLQAAAKKLTYQKARGKRAVAYYGICLAKEPCAIPQAALLYSTKGVNPASAESVIMDGRELFMAGRGGLFVCGQSGRTAAANNGIDYRAYPIAGYTDMVRYMGVVKGLSEKKEYMCAEFVKSLTTVEAQTKLKSIEVFSTLNLKLYGGDEEMGALEEALENAEVPNAYVWTMEFERLNNSFAAAFTSDEAARNAYLSLMSTLSGQSN